MKNPVLFSVFVLFILSCNNQKSAKKEAQNVVKTPIFPTISFQEIFDSNDVKGAFLFYDLKKDTTLVFNKPRTNIAYIPASTFTKSIDLKCSTHRLQLIYQGC